MAKVSLKTPEAIAHMRESAQLVSRTLGMLSAHVRPGANTLELDKLAEAFIRDHGAVPAFKNYQPSGHSPFPFTLCVSINEEVVHGMPSADKILQDGDVVSIDCGVKLNGYFGDSAYTFKVGEVDAKTDDLLEATKTALNLAVEQVRPGNRMGDLGFAVQQHIKAKGYGIVREMVGHGIGTNLHEPPEVPNYGRRGQGVLLKPGLVIAIEPMITLGSGAIRTAADGWTIVSADRTPAAHYEHTVAVTESGPQVLTSFDVIEAALQAA